MSRAELSIEISHLVSRLLSGEAVDTAACGEELAARFPDVGMTGEMIAEAIVSAAGMVGMIREGDAAATAGGAKGAPASVDDELTAAIDAELEEVVRSGSETADGDAAAAAANGTPEIADAADKPAADTGTVFGRSAMAAVRRAFSRG